MATESPQTIPKEYLQGADGPELEHSEGGYVSLGNKVIPYEANGYKSVLMVKQTMARLANDIYNHNMASKFTAVMINALPGSGKSTFDQHLVHELHLKNPQYRVYYFENKAITELDEILKTLPKYTPSILVFSDVSFILQKLPKSKVIDILDRLTRIREVLDPENKKTPSILITEYHYSFAVLKSIRQSPFKIYLSITDEERENYLKQMGYHNRQKILDYTRMYLASMRYGKWYVHNPHDDINGGRPFWYYRDKPFRAALVSNFGELHLTFFHTISCEVCRFKKNKIKPDVKFFQQYVEQQGYSAAKRALERFAYNMTGSKLMMEKHERAAYNALVNHFHKQPFDVIAVAQIVRDLRKMPKSERPIALVEKLSMVEGKEAIDKEVTDKTVQDAMIRAEQLAAAGDNDSPEIGEGDEPIYGLDSEQEDEDSEDDI